jgi:hypothetical protein
MSIIDYVIFATLMLNIINTKINLVQDSSSVLFFNASCHELRFRDG